MTTCNFPSPFNTDNAPEDNMLPAIIKYQEFTKWAKIVEGASLSAIHHSCSEFNISNFQNLCGQIHQATMEEM
jgi:hypothetical protein